jgi:hypothetical protein
MQPAAVHLLVVDHRGNARCEPWQLDPGTGSGARGGELVNESHGVRRSIDYWSKGDRLAIDRLTTTIDGESKARRCEVNARAREVTGGIEVNGAQWFRDPATCTAALARHARVAFEACGLEPVPDPVRANRVRAQFERALAAGGTLWSPVMRGGKPACAAIAVKARGNGGGTMSTRVNAGTRTWTYSYGSGEIGFANETTVLDRPPANIGRYATLCATVVKVTWREDSAAFGSEPFYASAAACEAAFGADKLRASWFPTDGGRLDVAGESPRVPSC